MEGIDFFVKLRDISDEIIEAYEKENEQEIEAALGKFALLMLQMDCMKGA